MKIEALYVGHVEYEYEGGKPAAVVTCPISLKLNKCAGYYEDTGNYVRGVYLLEGFEERLDLYFNTLDASQYPWGSPNNYWKRNAIRYADDGETVAVEGHNFKFTFDCTFSPASDLTTVLSSKVVIVSNYNPTIQDHVMRELLHLYDNGYGVGRYSYIMTSMNCTIEPANENEASLTVYIEPKNEIEVN